MILLYFPYPYLQCHINSLVTCDCTGLWNLENRILHFKTTLLCGYRSLKVLYPFFNSVDLQKQEFVEEKISCKTILQQCLMQENSTYYIKSDKMRSS